MVAFLAMNLAGEIECADALVGETCPVPEPHIGGTQDPPVNADNNDGSDDDVQDLQDDDAFRLPGAAARKRSATAANSVVKALILKCWYLSNFKMRVSRMPEGLASFKLGVLISDVVSSSGKKLTHSNWGSKLSAMGYPLNCRYSCAFDDLSRPIPPGSRSCHKVYWVCWLKTLELFPELKEKGIVRDEDKSLLSTVSSAMVPIPMERLVLEDHQKFKGAHGRLLEIDMFGALTEEDVHYGLDSVYGVFNYQNRNGVDPAFIRYKLATVEGKIIRCICLATFRHAVFHFAETGCKHAQAIEAFFRTAAFELKYLSR